jgi:hypothetical protein
MAGPRATGRGFSPSIQSAELSDQVGEILAKQYLFMDDIVAKTDVLTALPAEEESNRARWIAVTEARHDVEEGPVRSMASMAE